MLPFMKTFRIGQHIEYTSGAIGRGKWKVITNGHGISFGGDESVLKLSSSKGYMPL
jgi:hypothetical protein